MRKPKMSHAEWLRLMRDGRDIDTLTRAYGRNAIVINAIKRGVNYQKWYNELLATGEKPAKPGSFVPEVREPHWTITQPWRLTA